MTAERKGPRKGEMTNAQAQIPILRACSWKKNLTLMSTGEVHIVDKTEADTLWGGCEETLQTACNDENDVVWCEGGEERHEEGEKHGPKEDGNTAESLSKGNSN
jgi:hypothetical protein